MSSYLHIIIVQSSRTFRIFLRSQPDDSFVHPHHGCLQTQHGWAGGIVRVCCFFLQHPSSADHSGVGNSSSSARSPQLRPSSEREDSKRGIEDFTSEFGKTSTGNREDDTNQDRRSDDEYEVVQRLSHDLECHIIFIKTFLYECPQKIRDQESMVILA